MLVWVKPNELVYVFLGKRLFQPRTESLHRGGVRRGLASRTEIFDERWDPIVGWLKINTKES